MPSIEDIKAYLFRLRAKVEGTWDDIKNSLGRRQRRVRDIPKPIVPSIYGPERTRRIRPALVREQLRERKKAAIAKAKEENEGSWRAWMMFKR